MKKWICTLLCLAALLSWGTLCASASTESPMVIDNADLLTAEEEAELTYLADAISDTYGIDALILTVDSLEGYSPIEYADHFYDSHAYSADCILFLLAMEEREWCMRTFGEADSLLGDRELDRLEDCSIYLLSDGEYYEGFAQWLDELPDCLESGADSQYAGDSGDAYGEDTFRIEIGLPFVIALAVAGIALGIMWSQMNTAKAQHGATQYMKDGSYQLTVQRDLFLYSNVTRTPKPKDNGGSHGGGSRGGRSGSF